MRMYPLLQHIALKSRRLILNDTNNAMAPAAATFNQTHAHTYRGRKRAQINTVFGK
jgi:hypothetical protein